VEPEEFEGFLNELMEDKNLFYVICPGSGGFDALFMLGSG
jgi:phosphomevalonate kinase